MMSSALQPGRPTSVILLTPEAARRVYDEASLASIGEHSRLVGFVAPEEIARRSSELAEVEVVFTGWGGGRVDAGVLDRMPRLRAIFYAGGTVKSWAGDEVWERGITVSNAYAANAIPVAEYAVGAILFSLKCGWHYLGRQQREQCYPLPVIDAPGGAGVTIGILSLGLIGRLVCERLRPFAFTVLACDPYASTADAADLGVELTSLRELFARSQVVSLHAPLLPATEGIITGELVGTLPRRATLINTARGGLVREEELAAALRRRPDLTALLDVLRDEPPPADHPLLGLPNAFVTPHIAGAMGRESWRLGRLMIEEFQRWRQGQPLRWQIRHEQLPQLA